MSTDLALFDELKADIALYVQPTKEMKVVDLRSGADVSTALKQIKSYRDRIEKQRKDLTGPLNDRVKAINEYVKTIAQPLLDAENYLKKQLLDYEVSVLEKEREAKRKQLEEERRAQLKKQEEEAALAAEAQAIFGADEAPPAPEEIAAAEEKKILEQNAFEQEAWNIENHKIKGTQRRWVFEVVDKSVLPAEFLVPDEKAIRKAILAGRTNIPGVKAWKEASLSVGRNTGVSRYALDAAEEHA